MSKLTDNTDEFKEAFNNSILSCLNEIGTVGKADLMSNCKVRTGALRRGHFFRTDKEGNNYKVIFINNVQYAPYVEFKQFSKGGRPWFRMTLRNDAELFNSIVKKYIKRGMKL